MEQYTVNRQGPSLPITAGKFFTLIHQRHIDSYGEIGANNIVQNVLTTYQRLMQQLASSPEGNHNSLLVGKVQSGKTSNLELLTALAFDNGYNFLLILGGYDKDLLRQSTERFGKTFNTLGGDEVLFAETPVLFTTNDPTKESVPINSLDPEFVKQLLDDKRPIIITCLKRPPAMKVAFKAISSVIEAVPGIRPFVIDDEGDQASLNTAKDKARNSTPTYKCIQKLKQELNNPLYLSVTATPQANIFQEDISDLIPGSIHTVQPGLGYDGASIYHLAENGIVVMVEEEDSKLMTESLKEAVYYFFIASAIKRLRASKKKEMLSDMIIHVDRTVAAHGSIYSAIHDMLAEIRQAFIEQESTGYYINLLSKSYNKFLNEELKTQYPFEESLLSEIEKVIRSTGAILQNGLGKHTKELEMTKLHKIFIGGDLLQRGLTFQNLIVSYFTRFAKSGGNMDTTLQRARWFGYRSKYLDLCKIFTTEGIAKEFTILAEVEDDLWEQFEDVENGNREISDIIIKADDTKQKPTDKNKAKFKTVSFRYRWIKQRFIVTDDSDLLTNNSLVDSVIASIHKWDSTTVGSSEINPITTALYAKLSAEQLKDLIKSINTAFDREPFNKQDLLGLVDQSDIPVILMWTNEDNKIRYRSIYSDSAHDRIKALHQGANTIDETKLTYLGDKKVIVDPTKINIQIHYISPGLNKQNRLGKDQYMFAIYLPKDKKYFVKDNDGV